MKKNLKKMFEKKFRKNVDFFFEIEILHEKNLKMYDEKKSQKFSKYFFARKKKKIRSWKFFWDIVSMQKS